MVEKEGRNANAPGKTRYQLIWPTLQKEKRHVSQS